MFGHDKDDENDKEVVHNAGFGTPAADDGKDETVKPDEPSESAALGGFVPTPAPTTTTPPAATDDLLDIKHEALQALTPLVGQLDQTPEEQFRTTMMMIQASDNHSLVKVAYEAAQKISSEKERAQALLDIVNEINYFTQQSQA